MDKIRQLTFTVKRGEDDNAAPRWQEANAVNANCPSCDQVMTVIIPGGEKQFVYAHCTHCRKYFIGE